MTVLEYVDQLNTKYGLQGKDKIIVSFSYGRSDYYKMDILIVDRLIIPKMLRKQGIGTSIMKLICDIAQRNNSIIMLSVTTEFGATSTDRLRKFYKRFGFVNNKGRTKLYNLPLHSMYRFPK